MGELAGKPFYLNPKEPMAVLDIELRRKWVCGECGQIYNDKESAYACCKMPEWPLDYVL